MTQMQIFPPDASARTHPISGQAAAPPQAFIATVKGLRFHISSRNQSRDTFIRNAADPSWMAPWSWKLLLPSQTPIMSFLSIVDAPFSGGALVPP